MNQIHRPVLGALNGDSKVWLLSNRRSRSSCVRTLPVADQLVVDKVIDGQRRKYLDIPAARQWPVVGTKLDFLLAGAGKKLHQFVDRRHRALGPIFRETLGPAEVVFVSSADGIRDMFKYEGKYPKHPLPEAWTMYNEEHQCKRGLFFMDDEEWLHNRKIMNILMMQNNNPFVSDVVRRSCVDLCAELDGRLPTGSFDEFVEVHDLIGSLYAWAVKGVTGIALGDEAMSDPATEALLVEFSSSLHKLFEHSAPLMSVPPRMARKFGLSMWSRYEQSASEILSMANRLVEIGLRNSTPSGTGLVAGMLKHGMPADDIKRIFADLIVAAGDTTAFTCQWALYLLASNPVAQAHVYSDICSDHGNFETPLVRGTIREAMRLYPVAVFVGRLFAVDGVIQNYEIPKHTMVCASLYTAGRDETSFARAAQFQPNRWMRQRDSGKYLAVDRPSSSVPYALGARSCVGQKVANVQMHCLISKILQHFELRLLNDKEIDIDIRMITVPSESVRIGIRRR